MNNRLPPEINSYARISQVASSQDYQILLRETKAINASLDWHKTPHVLSITVHAPTHFLWASTKESQLTYECPHNQSRDAVRELLAHMEQGFTRKLTTFKDHEDTCECDSCENNNEELDELDF